MQVNQWMKRLSAASEAEQDRYLDDKLHFR